ncbi:MAG: PD-(D/E)XK nuclease family protein, partial [Clostridia bacterium]|nr:PD-(D/E)XK nuclease family protein [Clostridia bacterium]
MKCHFAYYCDHVLNLRETEAAAFKYSDSGTFIHHILKTFMESVVDTDKNCIKRGLEG